WPPARPRNRGCGPRRAPRWRRSSASWRSSTCRSSPRPSRSCAGIRPWGCDSLAGRGENMPGLSPIKILGNLKFLSAGLKLASQKGSGEAKSWRESSFRDRDPKPGEMAAFPKTIPPWFMPRKPGYEPHQKSCDEVGKNFKDLHDTMIDAVQFSHNMWKLQAKFKDLKIMAVAGTGTPE